MTRESSEDQPLWVDLVAEPLSVQGLHEFVSGDPRFGGIVTFAGVTRSDPSREHGNVTCLEYEAYPKMARRQLARLASEAARRWSAGRVAVVHRVGRVPAGDASVVVAVACPHRAEAFEACRWLIDTLKKDVPIWKKDVYADGHTEWAPSNDGDRGKDGFEDGQGDRAPEAS